MFEYTGNLHVHSTYSDGAGTIEDIAKEAERAGVDFVGVTDHHHLKGLKEGKEVWHGRTLVLIGMEVGELHNHYLAWRIKTEVADHPDNPQAVIDAVKAQGGIGFIAHPFEKGCKYGFSGHAYTWEDWNISGNTGICIWNFTSQWKGPIDNPVKAIYYYLYRRGAVRGPDRKTLAKWDAQLANGKSVAIGGTDAHAFRFSLGPLSARIFPYRYLFKTINTHILTDIAFTGELEHDKALVYDAIERGRCFVGYDLLGSTRGFRFTASGLSGTAVMGGEITLGEDSVRFEIILSKAAHVRVLKDGDTWREGYGARHILTARQPGVYRVEVYRRGLLGKLRAWIFSNPIYVR